MAGAVVRAGQRWQKWDVILPQWIPPLPALKLGSVHSPRALQAFPTLHYMRAVLHRLCAATNAPVL